MEMKLVKNIPLRRCQSIVFTPFAVIQENSDRRVYVINSDNILEEFCHFPLLPRANLQFSQIYWYQHNKIVAKVYKGNKEKYLICSKGMEQSLFIPADVTDFPFNIYVISEDMFLCDNTNVYSFPGNKKIMCIPMENAGDYHVDFCASLGNGQYIVVFREKMYRNYHLKRIDVADKTIISEIEIARPGQITPLIHHEFACIEEHQNGVTMHFYNTDLKEYKEIDLKGLYYQTIADHTENYIYTVVEGENRILKVDYRSGVQESISIPEMKSSWILCEAMDGFLYFMVSGKTMKVFDTKKEKLISLTFQNEIIELEIHNKYVFVLSGSDTDNDFDTGVLLKEGVIQVHQLIP